METQMFVDMHTQLVNTHVRNAEDMMGQLMSQQEEVTSLYTAERNAYHVWQTAVKSLEELLDSAVGEAQMEAYVSKSGPLAGIAVSSDAYKVAVRRLRNELLAKQFVQENALVLRTENAYRTASIDFENAKTRLNALHTVSNLEGNLLRALSV